MRDAAILELLSVSNLNLLVQDSKWCQKPKILCVRIIILIIARNLELFCFAHHFLPIQPQVIIV